MTGGLTISRSACKTFRVSGSATPPAGESSAGCARYTATRSPKAGAAKGGPRGGAYVTALGDEAPGEIATAFIVGRGTQVPCLSRISGGGNGRWAVGGPCARDGLAARRRRVDHPAGGMPRWGFPRRRPSSRRPCVFLPGAGSDRVRRATDDDDDRRGERRRPRAAERQAGARRGGQRRIGAACRALGRHGYAGEIFGVRAAGERPGRVVEQDPGPGYRGGEGQLVHLVVTAPFRGALTRASSCVDRTDDSGAASSPPGSRPPRVCYGYFWFRPTASPLPRVTSEA